jgi:DNA-binding GntR family transcriptional regulator
MSGVPFNRIAANETRRIVDVVYGLLRRSIMLHELEGGFHLSVPALAEQFGISRSPVREAVQRLVAEGLVIEVPRRGVFVQRYNVAELIPIYQVRMALDGLAARLATENVTQATAETIQKVLLTEKLAIENDNIELHIETDMEFHWKIIECARNPVLSEAQRNLYNQIRAAIAARVVRTGPQTAYQDHVKIFKAVKSGNRDAAEAAARAHVERLLSELSKLETN